MFYRVSHIEMCDCKWFWGVEGSIILLIFLWRHVQEQWAFDFWPLYFIQVPKTGLHSLWKRGCQISIMEFQVQFWHPSDLRLWRTGYVIYVKIDWWNSNAHYSRTCLQRKFNKIIDPSIPQNHLQSHISMWDTL